MATSASYPLGGYALKEQIAVCEAGFYLALNYCSALLKIAFKAKMITATGLADRREAVIEFTFQHLQNLRRIKTVAEIAPFFKISKKMIALCRDFKGTEDPCIWERLGDNDFLGDPNQYFSVKSM